MTNDEKIVWLQRHAWQPYVKAKAKAQKELDELTPVFCFCGALATGLHTSRCRKFQDLLKIKIISKLKRILPKE